MSWNYRMVRHIDSRGRVSFRIHEAYYDEQGNPTTISVDAYGPEGESPDHLRDYLELMLEACAKPALHFEDFDDV
jgi:hypothetical protein